MSFWTDQAFREPLRQNRWYLSFSVDKSSPHYLNQQLYALKNCSKPSITLETVEALQINTFKYFPRTYKWKPITINMVSGVGNKGHYSAAQALYQIFFGIPSIDSNGISKTLKTYGGLNKNQKFDENDLAAPLDTGKVITKYTSEEQIELLLAEEAELDEEITLTNIYRTMPRMQIIQVNPEGQEIEKWTLFVPIITDINWGQLNYENDGFVDIEFRIQYWHAELQTFINKEDYIDKLKEEEKQEDEKYFRRQKELEIEAAKKRKEEQFLSDFKAADVFSPLQQVQNPIAQQQTEAQAENRQKATDILNQSGIKQGVSNIQTENQFQRTFNPEFPIKEINNQQNISNQIVTPQQQQSQQITQNANTSLIQQQISEARTLNATNTSPQNENFDQNKFDAAYNASTRQATIDTQTRFNVFNRGMTQEEARKAAIDQYNKKYGKKGL